MNSSSSFRLTLLPQPAFWQVVVSISPSSTPRNVRTMSFVPQPGLMSPLVGNSPTSFMAPKRTTSVLGALRAW